MNPPRPGPLPGASSPLADKAFHVSRRTFVKKVATVAALTGLPTWFVERSLARAAEPAPTVAPLDRPGVALIGCGGMGRADTGNAANHGDIVALCDVDATHLAEAAERFAVDGRKPALYSDYRRLLERKDVHAVVNATPDHWHSLVNLGCALAKKDVYAEKPLTLTVDEGKRVVDAVNSAGIVLQTGTQQRSMTRFRLACELVRNGRIGALRQVDVFLPAGVRGGPFPTAPVPAGLNWDFWLGQTPKVDFVPQRCHGSFRYWYDYSGGTMTDWGAHHIDIAHWAIGLPAPEAVEGRPLADLVPGGYTAFAEYDVQYTYPGGIVVHVRSTTDDLPNGEKAHPEGQRNGIRFEGPGGWIWVNRNEIKASTPELLTTPLPEGSVRLAVSNEHMGNFFDCIRSRARPICDVETGHRSATLCHIGVIALRTGRKLRWDGNRQKFAGDHAHEANGYLKRKMRKPYNYDFNG